MRLAISNRPTISAGALRCDSGVRVTVDHAMTGDDNPDGRDCRFCAIAAGKTQTELIIHSNEQAIAFPAMHQRPSNRGHTLVVTRRHVTDLPALDAELWAGVMAVLVTVAAALERDGAAGTTVIQHNGAAGGQDTFHLHFHVVPRHRDDGFYRDPEPWPRGLEPVSEGVLAEQAGRLRAIVRSDPVEDQTRMSTGVVGLD